MTIDTKKLAEKIREGDRRALARAITLIESGRDDHQALAEALIADLLPETGNALTLGISGTPGAGKSTFIEALGRHVIAGGEKIAVLAVDPSSRRSGGSILGDKTRMQSLAASTSAFVRPSPAGATLGGVARRTREAAIACEAAGFGVIVLETVGVGQSETAVADMVDCFLLLLAPGAGDDLQGIKRGIVELADLVIVNKADGDLLAEAKRVCADYQAALHLLRPASPAWTPQVLTCSALKREGIDEVWQMVLRHRQAMDRSGELGGKRARQRKSWLWAEVQAELIDRLRRDPATAAHLQDLERQVASGELLPPQAARLLIDKMTD
ncbi:MAG: methylmalonyl Co-A mutase-associated GTPase MeaB [Alphaproteobacteria bacterium]|nr:methylmalonyl Co-A mutase-associated GTPase MeaB [Alphaproteobacteria bacterium]